MNCMKCGRELNTADAFCPECRERMKRYPVRPGTAVILPPRNHEEHAKKQMPRKRILSADEQIAILKKRVNRLVFALIVCVVIIAMLGVISGHVVRELGLQKLLGQNYSTIIQTEPPETSQIETTDTVEVTTP